MGRRGRGAGGPPRGSTGIFLEFAKPNTASKKPEHSTQTYKTIPTSTSNNASPIFFDELEQYYEKCTSKNFAKEPVEALIEYWSKEIKKRSLFYEQNQNPNYEVFESLLRNKKLDSTLKKCAGFVKKLKNMNSHSLEATEKEVEVLNLTKYLSEICLAISETKYKDRNQLWSFVSICSKLHQRYREFSATLADLYKGKLGIRLNDCDWNIVVADLRFFTELVICGIIGEEGYAIIGSVLRQLVLLDKENSSHMYVMLIFLKDFGLEVAGIFSSQLREACNEHGIPIPISDLVHPQRRFKIKIAIDDYMSSVCNNLSKLHDEYIKIELLCRKFFKTKGEIPKDKDDARKDFIANYELFLGSAKRLAFYSGVQLPDLPQLPPDEEEEELANLSDHSENSSVPRSTFFDDEECRSFYQDIPDLTKYLTSAAKRETDLLLEKQAAARKEAEDELDMELELAELQSDEQVAAPEDVDLEPESSLPSTSEIIATDEDKFVPPKLTEFLQSMKDCVNRNMVDDAAEKFLCNFNTKQNRKKLIRHLSGIPRQRVDLLPLWSRFIAILNPVIPDVGVEMVEFLNKELRFLIRRCHPTFIETKLKITRYIGELVKFGIFPPMDAFNVLRLLLSNFTAHQLEMACAFIECCGRYLYKNPATKKRLKVYMDVMMRKKQVKVLNPRHNDLVEQAYYAVFPPETSIKVKKVPVLQAYLQEIIYAELKRKNVEETIKILRRLDWDNPKVFNLALKIFSQPWKIPSNKYSMTCSVLSGLVEYQPLFATAVSDTVLTFLLDRLNFVDVLNNQQLTALATYISELFCYNLYSCDTILQLLYALITKGISYANRKFSPCDPPRSTFRLRLVTVLLKGCGDYFLDDKVNKSKLRFFLQYLQKYMYFKKEHPTWEKGATNLYSYEPFHVVIDLAHHLFPKMKILETYENACKVIEQIELIIQKKVTEREAARLEAAALAAEAGYGQSISPLNDAEDGTFAMFRGVESLSAQQPGDYITNASGVNNIYYPEGTYYTNATSNLWSEEMEEEGEENMEEVQNLEDDFEFDRMLDRIRNEAVYGTREARLVNTDIRIPMNLQKKQSEEVEQPEGTVSYAILLKKGHKTNVKHVDVPENSEFVQRMRVREKIEREERAEIKERTLQISRMQMDEEMEMELNTIRNNFRK